MFAHELTSGKTKLFDTGVAGIWGLKWDESYLQSVSKAVQMQKVVKKAVQMEKLVKKAVSWETLSRATK